ncbi:uncharacterized protein LOC131686841 [Topomyia yanbarensis]|uniref:uncharacterized protein LOC131686841 n=1 Tax=Topomyia yanbarensis TaxID=2498891 RepID=UPI00273BE2EF|nr:uncharacterized protein LOC131686841 [Topomyia yanbarensis]
MSASKRGTNWTTQEDEALCAAWLNTSQDASIGINQRAKTLYDRVFDRFLEICSENHVPGNPELRAPSGIKARWHHISKMASKFAGCVAQIENRCQSGASPEDFLRQAIALFATTEKTPFTLMHCYSILQSAPKWQQYHTVKKSPTPKRLAAEIDLARGETDLPDPVPSSSDRPIGQKACKAQRLSQGCASNHVGSEIAKAGNMLAIAAKERLMYCRQKALALSRMANHAIMSVDINGLNETAREFYLLEQKRILNETKEAFKNELEPRPEPLDDDREDVENTIENNDVVDKSDSDGDF